VFATFAADADILLVVRQVAPGGKEAASRTPDQRHLDAIATSALLRHAPHRIVGEGVEPKLAKVRAMESIYLYYVYIYISTMNQHRRRRP
jgi:hypothetical protein